MRVTLIVAMAVAVFVALSHRRALRLDDRVGEYLDDRSLPEPHETGSMVDRLRHPGIGWVAVGVLVGTLAAQGDLFLAGPGRSAIALGLLGGAAGWFIYSAHRSSQEERRIRRIRYELPTIADAIAMHVVSGESVRESIDQIVRSSRGAVSDELADVLARTESHESLATSLEHAAAAAAHPDARRLYETLAHAHEVGGGLSTGLASLATDFRASLARDLTAEGGRRAISSYGPVLALMVPTALLFLLYPTLLGLRTLSGSP